MAVLANAANLQINYVKEGGTYKDLTDADATEEFWKNVTRFIWIKP